MNAVILCVISEGYERGRLAARLACKQQRGTRLMATTNHGPEGKSTSHPIPPQPAVKAPSAGKRSTAAAGAEKPTAEAHHEAAAVHAKAEQAHKAAAKALSEGKIPEAKAHAAAAAQHGDEAADLSNEVAVLYEFWIE